MKMSKRKRVKKNAFASLPKNQKKGNEAKKKSTEKKRKVVKSPNSVKELDFKDEGQSSGSVSNQVLLDDLPPEMLTKILKSVDSATLFECRFVNRKLNSISSEILQHRPESEISFKFDYGTFSTESRDEDEKNPWDFLQLFKQSKSCPFARFNFWVDATSKSSVPSPDFFECEDFNEFLAHFNSDEPTTKIASTSIIKIPAKIKCLKFEFYFDYKAVDLLETVTKKLRVLLLHKIPDLEEFGLNFSCEFDAPKFRFSPVQFQLPHLKILHLEHGMIQEFPGIFQDLLKSAVNLKKIRFDSDNIFTLEEIQFLFFVDNPILVQNSVIKITDELLSLIKQEQGDSPAPVWFPMLKFEDIALDIRQIDPVSTTLLQNLLEFSKNTLTYLTMAPLGFEPPHRLHIDLPVFKNLRQLSLQQSWNRPSLQFFPAGTRPIQPENSNCDWTTAGIFPAVDSLDLQISDWSTGFPQQDSIPVFPLVKILTIYESQLKFPEKSIPVISLMCPNLKHFQIQKTETLRLEFSPLARLIWTHMKQLETLEIPLDLSLPANDSAALDSCFTGFSLADCSRLSEMMEAKKTLQKWGVRTKIPKAKLTAEREYPSILDMKDLTKLVVNPYSREKKVEKEDFNRKLSWVSEEFAFKLVPHLKQQ